MGEIRFEDHFFVFIVKTELEGSVDGGVGGTRVVEIAPPVFLAEEEPVELNAVEGVDYFLVAFHGGGDVVFLLELCNFEYFS